MGIFGIKKLVEIIKQLHKKKTMSPSAMELLQSLRGKRHLIEKQKNDLKKPINDYFKFLDEAALLISKNEFNKAEVKLQDAYQTTEVVQEIIDDMKRFMLTNQKKK